jgi:hypothetical protein
MTDQARRTVNLWLEWGLWVTLAVAAYWLTFDFDEPLDVYAFGASGWPRFILVCVVVGATAQLLLSLMRLRGGAAALAAEDGAEEDSEASVSRTAGFNPRLLGIFGLPLVYLLLLPRTGFFVTTPFFIIAFLWILEVRKPRLLFGVALVVYAIVLLVFTRLFYVALPIGNWPGFYDANNWIVVFVRQSLFGD